MRASSVIVAATLGAAAYVWWRGASVDAGGDATENTDIGDWINSTWEDWTLDIDMATALSNPNVQAFSILVRTGEGTLGADGYRTMFTGRLFDSYADHPRQAISANGITSTAAGAYQMLARTWDEMRAKYNLPDFSPASQDIAFVGLLRRRGALADVIAGRFEAAIRKCNREWASLPGSPYGQPTLTWDRARAVLAQQGASEGVAA
ncbi:Phage lysin, 1,4-beta-N-acetylmuramidase or lysozyme, Protein S in phage lambda [Cupriavidus sp. U2]|uniref:glycoside hydrolase family 24 protein n=1 Tax=Cupriavidus sp. U2 TaxID=2920269 RepID=UPI00129E9DB1|nr:glycoside hydrolase family 104 protein [Cupriavidus sp. U2]KAI3589322.1 Phage lysin, 1,4-beta-N-acetylmuramidase or lysozyme, Protein S in phage lambda [Cupriavidus sp. U2]